ncbi:MAG: RNA 2',3'-cyclic phosphodiesterase [Phycisphaerae bacterium]|nr:RNA 2',3'-cyclic phosphodiesterase [Phycisphaerae bacterium]
MRTFIAIDIGEKVAANIGVLQGEINDCLAGNHPGIKWVDPGLIHLTLKFLGDVDENQIAGITEIVAGTAEKFKKFAIEVEKVNSFGRPPRVVWIGIKESDILCRLQSRLDSRLTKAGFEADEKKFVGHLTLCRVKNPATGKQIKRIIKAFEGFSAGKIHVKSICVYKSELTKTGPEYTLLSRNDLA